VSHIWQNIAVVSEELAQGTYSVTA